MTNEELSAKVAEAKGDDCECFDFCSHAFDCTDCPDRKHNVKPYSTDMNSAWELVEDIRLGGAKIELFPDPDSDGWVFVIFTEKTIQSFVESTMPRAICKAYLKWKENN